MSITRQDTLIPYFSDFSHYLFHYFYNLKTKCDQKKWTSESNVYPENIYVDKSFFMYV